MQHCVSRADTKTPGLLTTALVELTSRASQVPSGIKSEYATKTVESLPRENSVFHRTPRPLPPAPPPKLLTSACTTSTPVISTMYNQHGRIQHPSHHGRLFFPDAPPSPSLPFALTCSTNSSSKIGPKTRHDTTRQDA